MEGGRSGNYSLVISHSNAPNDEAIKPFTPTILEIGVCMF